MQQSSEVSSQSTNKGMAPQIQQLPLQLQSTPQMQPVSALQKQLQPLTQFNSVQWENPPLQQPTIQGNSASGNISLVSQHSTNSTLNSAGTAVTPLASLNKTKRSATTKSPTPSGTKRSGVGPTPEVAQQLRFPWKLHLLLERCEYEHEQRVAAAAAEGKSLSYEDMPISWLPCGKAFKVHDKERFVKEIMPSFFGTQSFKTFQRNLNLWGFTRVSKGPQKDVCSHPLFLKGFPAVCQSMKRIVLKGTGRGNRAPLGGVDVSSVQAVVAAAAMQQAQQKQHHILQQQLKVSTERNAEKNDVVVNNVHHQNPQQFQVSSQHQQQQFVIEDGSIHAAPEPSQQKLVVLPSGPAPATLATSTVLWPNNNNGAVSQQQQQQQQLQGTTLDPNVTLQNSLQQLSALIQQLNGCNSMATAAINSNSVKNTGSPSGDILSATNFQQQPQIVQAPIMIMQPQHQALQQQQQAQQSQLLMSSSLAAPAPTTIGSLAPAPLATQDLIALLLQRNIQQQASQQQQQQVQLQVPLSSTSFIGTQQASSLPQLQQQQSLIQQQTSVGNSANLAQQQPKSLQSSAPAVASGLPQQQQQQQNQLLQLLLQQNGLTSPPPV